MTVTVVIILIVIICSFIIVHHIYKLKDELDEIKEIVSRIERTQNRFFKQTDQQLTQIDWSVSEIEDVLHANYHNEDDECSNKEKSF